MNLKRIVRWIGPIDDKQAAETMNKMAELPPSKEPIGFFRCSCGGLAGVGLAFYDYVRSLRLNLETIAVGDVSSAAILVWLAGEPRFVTPHTTMLAHPVRLSMKDVGAIEVEETGALRERGALWSKSVMDIMTANSHGQLDRKRISSIVRRRKVFTPQELVDLKLADKIYE